MLLKLKLRILKYYSILKDCCLVVKQCFRNKKIVIISDKQIVSVPVSWHIQTVFVVSILTIMLWLSFSTGKYIAYDSILDEKEKEIFETSLDNEELKFTVSDLSQNLKEFDKYFSKIELYDQLAKNINENQSTALHSGQDSGVEEDVENLPSESAHKIIQNIKSKVIERIEGLESVIKMTGIHIDQVAANRGDISSFDSDENSQENRPQGGPFVNYDEISSNVEFNQEVMQKNIKYLIDLEKIIHQLPLAMPMDKYYRSSRFGKRIDPIRKRIAMHSGLDLVGKYKAEIHSTAPGVVTYARPSGAYGKLVEIDHGNGITTRYGHLSKILVSKGDKVSRWQVVGLQGSSGRSTGNHLHYEVRRYNKPIDPEKFLNAGQYVFQTKIK